MSKRKINFRKLNTKKLITYGVGAAGMTATAIGAKKALRKGGQIFQNNIMEILMTDPYDENLYELISSTSRLGIKNVMETNLRCTEGKIISRPMGSPKQFPSLDSLLFSPAQLYTMPIEFNKEVDVSVTIGKQAKKPLDIDIPIIIAPMAYGIALSKSAKIALAKGSALAGTATSSGEGPVIKEERNLAHKYIFQYNRGEWGKTEENLTNCDAIEIQFGQGALLGMGHIFKKEEMDKELQKAYGFEEAKDVIAHSKQPEVSDPSELPKLVEKLKKISGGVPIGAKITPSKYFEADLNILCDSGVDYITIDSAEAATKGSAPILQDDFGIPLVFAVNRAAEWLYKNNFKDRVSLIAGGKIRNPGDMLKVCALGADACMIGSIALLAISHTQVLKVLPYEPPTQLVWYNAKKSYNKKFNVEEGSQSLKNFLFACKEEICEGIRAIGKTKLSEVDKQDLMSIDEMIAKGCQVPMVHEPFDF
jgi:glutamate synthase domain-containing protein 2